MGEFEYRILSDDTEEQLIDWAKQGNQAAFELLLKKYRPRMFSWVSKLTHSLKLDITDVNDVVQEASIKAWINIRNFRGESQLSTWLYTITFHQAINLSHKNNRYSNTHRFSDIEAQYARNGDYGEKHDLFDMAIDIDMPEDIFAAKEVQKKVQQIIDGLPKSLREVIILREYDQLTYEQIAEKTATKLGTVKTQIHRAREKIFEELSNWSKGTSK